MALTISKLKRTRGGTRNETAAIWAYILQCCVWWLLQGRSDKQIATRASLRIDVPLHDAVGSRRIGAHTSLRSSGWETAATLPHNHVKSAATTLHQAVAGEDPLQRKVQCAYQCNAQRTAVFDRRQLSPIQMRRDRIRPGRLLRCLPYAAEDAWCSRRHV